ncbi:MAG: valine--tRNA ligase [Clostridia bacterium]|nr:valine--tRNA ligase [Clostridia bacterium]
MCEKHSLEGKFDPKSFENEIYEGWMEKGYFKPLEDKSKKPYTIVIPPPNITGKLHMGHALDETLQDILIRYKRMRGYNTLWLPGTDHASIATEAKIVEKLKEEGTSKEELGREEFLKRAWDWKEEYGGTILNQLKKLGCSCDWEKERFTMDEGLSNAVKHVFVKLYHKGLIYRGKRMINWCPYCNTSISDAEVEYEEEQTHLWHIKYPVKGEEGKYIIVATTRPETMLGDTGVAVHPEDQRYKDLVGKTVILPIMNKEIPIIADEFVEKEFGTGAVKLTPAHDTNDYQAALKHSLEIVEVFDENFKMGNLYPEYAGMDLYEARKRIVQQLEEEGYLVKVEDYTHNVGKCYRCHNTIEPKISEQWFVKMKPLAEPAIKAVKEEKIKFVPERFDKIYYNWMENIQDWCISRQLWWGHRIPAYYCIECGEIIVDESKPETCLKCGSTHLKQDEDTLDTWFSSALWPFSTLGWPEETEDFKYFYPTSTLVTGYDIIFFWVARMIFSGIEHTGKVPFDTVFIHGIVRDSQGRKMSKSLGNGIDPLEVIDKYGTDALRFSLVSGISPGNDIRYMPEKLEAASNFANKLWNAAKFVSSNLAEEEKVREFCYEAFEKNKTYDPNYFKLEDKWILNKFDKLVVEVTKNIENYDLGIAIDKIYSFIWNEFCDWYIEMVKPRIYSDDEKIKVPVSDVLSHILASSLKLLHPFMPFITEKIYPNLITFGTQDLIVAKWPDIREKFIFDKEEEFLEKMKKIIIEVRNVRANRNIHPSKKSELIFVTKQYEKELLELEEILLKLGFGTKITIQKDKTGIANNAIAIMQDGVELYMPLEDLVDIAEERKRLQGEKAKLELEVQRSEKMLSNPGFINKAPEAKIKEEKEKLEKYQEMLRNVEERLQNI